MKNIIIAISLLLLIGCNPSSTKKRDTMDVVKIKICKVIEHEAIDSVVSGIEDFLEKQPKKFEISAETCQGNMAIASQIITKFSNTDADIIVTIGTTPSQCAAKLAKSGKIKMVFSSVTNPEDISTNLKNANITGVSNFIDLNPQIKLFKKLQPSMKKLGIVFNVGESNSVYIVKKLQDVCMQNNITLLPQGISRISDISQAVIKLLDSSSDAIFISNDNLALSGIKNIIKLCNHKKIPVYVSDTDQVCKGCLAALGPNQYEIGTQTGKLIWKIANGTDINNIPVEYPRSNELYLNAAAAKKLGIELSEDVKSSAKKIYE